MKTNLLLAKATRFLTIGVVLTVIFAACGICTVVLAVKGGQGKGKGGDACVPAVDGIPVDVTSLFVGWHYNGKQRVASTHVYLRDASGQPAAGVEVTIQYGEPDDGPYAHLGDCSTATVKGTTDSNGFVDVTGPNFRVPRDNCRLVGTVVGLCSPTYTWDPTLYAPFPPDTVWDCVFGRFFGPF